MLLVASALAASCANLSGLSGSPGDDGGRDGTASKDGSKSGSGSGSGIKKDAGHDSGMDSGSTSGSGSGSSSGSGSGSESSSGGLDAGALATCPTPLPTGNVTSGGHTWTLIGQDDFTKDAALGSFGTSNAATVVYTGDHGLGWIEYPDGWPSTFSNGAVGYEPSQVQSVHDGVLDWYLHSVNGNPVAANPSPLPGGNQYQTYGRYSVCLRLEYDDAHNLTDFVDAFLLWPESDSNWQFAESDYPNANLNGTSFDAFAHYGGAGAQDYFSTASTDLTQWHVYTQEWGPGFRSYYFDGTLIGTSTNQVWSMQERWQLQAEPTGQNDGDSGHQYVDWAAIWSY